MVEIHDTTLRDGEQMPGVIFTPDEKLELAEMFVDFGVNYLDIMPSVSVSEALVAKELAKRYGDQISASCRLKQEDIDLAKELELKRVTIFTPVSDLHLKYKLQLTHEENLERGIKLVTYAVKSGLIVDFAFEDAARANEDYLLSYIRALDGNVAINFIADTVGRLTPDTAYDLFERLKKQTKAKLGVHAHNDFGLATANTLAAIRAGTEVFSGTFTGIGERAGNTPIEEVCCALRYVYNESLSVKYKLLYKIAGKVQNCSGIKLQPNKAIVGKNAFAHESGIHADGIIKHSQTYEIISPEEVGSKRTFYFGKTSGKGALRYTLGKDAISEHDTLRLFEEIKALSESCKLTLSQAEVQKLYESIEQEALSYKDFEESLYEFEKRNRIVKEFTQLHRSDPYIKGLILVGSVAHSPDKITKNSDIDTIVVHANRNSIAKALKSKKMTEAATDVELGIVDIVRYSEMVGDVEHVQHTMPLDLLRKICDSTILYLRELRNCSKTSAKIPTFGGLEQEVNLQMVHKKEGYIIRVPVSLEVEGKYYGGPHQDMLLANPRVLYDSDGLIKSLIDTLWYRTVEKYWNQHKQLEIEGFIKKFKRYLSFSDETEKFINNKYFDAIRRVVVVAR